MISNKFCQALVPNLKPKSRGIGLTLKSHQPFAHSAKKITRGGQQYLRIFYFIFILSSTRLTRNVMSIKPHKTPGQWT